MDSNTRQTLDEIERDIRDGKLKSDNKEAYKKLKRLNKKIDELTEVEYEKFIKEQNRRKYKKAVTLIATETENTNNDSDMSTEDIKNIIDECDKE
uniref:Uncharacterized protein n=1 Tax=viral metagenome TaxID=1070528 RepID=A0A6C0EA47_9ZZZZ